MNYLRIILFITLCASFCAQGETLSQVYNLALDNDTTLQAAYASLKANEQAVPEAIAQMVPQLTINYQTVGASNNLAVVGEYNTRTYSLNLSQPLYRPELWARLEGARHQVKGATAAYLNASQDLVIRVSEQYFAILTALNNLHFTQAARKSFGLTLEQAQHRLDVGLIAITDVQNAKAKYDSAKADEIFAENALADQYEKLRQITKVPIKQACVIPFKDELPLKSPVPNEIESWVTMANEYNLNVITARESALQAKAAIGIPAANFFPRIDLVGSVQRNKNPPPFPLEILTTTKSITLNATMSIFEGGGTVFRTTEARNRYEEAEKNYEGQIRQADSDTRQAYRGVLSNIERVKALAAAVKSNQISLEATKASYEVGSRTIVEVLDAETQLFNSKREYSKARYDYLFEGLRLKRAAGTLNQEDLEAVNALIRGCTIKDYNNA